MNLNLKAGNPKDPKNLPLVPKKMTNFGPTPKTWNSTWTFGQARAKALVSYL